MSEKQKKQNEPFLIFNRPFYIIYILLSMYSLYISFDCNNNIFSFETLIAILFPFIYIPLRLYTRSTCSNNTKIGPICIA